MSRRHVAIFTRAPVAGETKTRLIPLLGADGAAYAQRLMTWHALETACALPDATVSLWCAGDVAHPYLRLCAAHFGVACRPQSEGDLGTRMGDCLQHLLRMHEQVLLTGSDCPALTVADLENAATALDHARMVFIPAEDGGYGLLGLSRAIDGMFEGVEWGTDTVLNQTMGRLAAAGIDPVLLPQLADCDRPEDLARWPGLLPE